MLSDATEEDGPSEGNWKRLLGVIQTEAGFITFDGGEWVQEAPDISCPVVSKWERLPGSIGMTDNAWVLFADLNDWEWGKDIVGEQCGDSVDDLMSVLLNEGLWKSLFAARETEVCVSVEISEWDVDAAEAPSQSIQCDEGIGVFVLSVKRSHDRRALANIELMLIVLLTSLAVRSISEILWGPVDASLVGVRYIEAILEYIEEYWMRYSG